MKPFPIILRIVRSAFPDAVEDAGSITFSHEGIAYTVIAGRSAVYVTAMLGSPDNITKYILRNELGRAKFIQVQSRLAELARRIRQHCPQRKL